MLSLNITKDDSNSCILKNGEVVLFPMSWYNQLLLEIREWRLEKSKLIGLPAYCVFPDKTMHSIINVLPTSRRHLWLVSGFNEIIISNYGDEIIQMIWSFFKDKDIVEIIYSANSFDLKNHKVKGILGFLDYLHLFNDDNATKDVPEIREDVLEEKKDSSRVSDYEPTIEKKSNYSKFVCGEGGKRIEINDVFEVEFSDGETMTAQIVKPTNVTVYHETGRRDGSPRFYPKNIRTLNPEDCYSVDTPFAKAVLNKWVNYEFQYSVNNIVVSGKITKISKNQDNK